MLHACFNVLHVGLAWLSISHIPWEKPCQLRGWCPRVSIFSLAVVPRVCAETHSSAFQLSILLLSAQLKMVNDRLCMPCEAHVSISGRILGYLRGGIQSQLCTCGSAFGSKGGKPGSGLEDSRVEAWKHAASLNTAKDGHTNSFHPRPCPFSRRFAVVPLCWAPVRLVWALWCHRCRMFDSCGLHVAWPGQPQRGTGRGVHGVCLPGLPCLQPEHGHRELRSGRGRELRRSPPRRRPQHLRPQQRQRPGPAGGVVCPRRRGRHARVHPA